MYTGAGTRDLNAINAELPPEHGVVAGKNAVSSWYEKNYIYVVLNF